MSLASFVRLAVAVPLAAGALLLAFTPAVFQASLRRYLGGRKGRSALRDWKRLARFRRKRPALKPDADPFQWQELGASTALLRWGFWGTLCLVVLVGAVWSAVAGWTDFFLEPSWLLVAAVVGTVVLSVAGLCYGCSVFAREKARGTAEALVLTGVRAGALYRAKLAAALRATWPAVTGVAVLGGLYAVLDGEVTPAVVSLVLWAAAGPPAAVLLGMVMSAPARSPAHALGGMLLVLLWCILLAWCVPVGFIGSVIGTILMLTLVKRWTAFRMSLLMGFIGSLTGWIMIWLLILTGIGPPATIGLYGGVSDFLREWFRVLVILPASAAHGLLWFFIGTSTFESGFLADLEGRGRG